MATQHKSLSGLGYIIWLVVPLLVTCSSTQQQSENYDGNIENYNDDQGLDGADAGANSQTNVNGQYDENANQANAYNDDEDELAIENGPNENFAANYGAENNPNLGVGNYNNPLPVNSAADVPPPLGGPENFAAMEADAISNAVAPVNNAPATAISPTIATPKLRDLAPVYANLWWIGYDFRKEDKLVRIELLTRGNPRFNVLQERNQGNQPELIVRFYETQLRRKVRRDVDATEFRSPVAYVRTRENAVQQSVDVVMTLRDNVRPRMFVKDGNVLLTFAIPERYFGKDVARGQPVGAAEPLANVDLRPEIVTGSAMPEVTKAPKRPYVPNPAATAFKMIPVDGGQEVEPMPVVDMAPIEAPITEELTPPSFTRESNVAANVTADTVTNAAVAAPVNAAAVSAPKPATKLPVPAVSRQAESFAPPQQPYAPAYQQPAPPIYQQPYAQPYGAPFPGYSQPVPPAGTAPQPISPPAPGEPKLDNPGLDDFDSEGTEDDANKFEVRRHQDRDDGLVLEAFGFFAVAQDSGLDPTAVPPVAETSSSSMSPAGGMELFDPTAVSSEMNATASGMDMVPVAAGELVGQDVDGPRTSYGGKAMELDFINAKLDHVLKVFAAESGYNFVVPQRIGQEVRVTLALKNVPWEEALTAILESEGLAMTRVGNNVIRVDRIENVNDYLQKEDTAKRVREQVTPRKMLVMRLNHARADELQTAVQAFINEQGGAGGAGTRVSHDKRTNSLIVEGRPDVLAKTRAVIERLDVPIPQAEIATRIVEVSRDASDFLGLSWFGGMNYDPGSGLGFGSVTFPNYVSSNFAVDTGLAPQAGSINLKLGSLNDIIDLDLRLRMEEKKGTTEILQSGKVVVQDGKSAKIEAGTKLYVRPIEVVGSNAANAGNGAQGTGAGQLQEVQFKLNLAIGEGARGISISREGRVTMPIKVNSDTPNASAQVIAADTRTLETEIVKASGETAVIGGIYNTNKRRVVIGVPFLSKIPILGALFRSTQNTETQTELLIMITPTVIEADGATMVSASDGSAASLTGNVGANLGNGYNNNNYGNNSGNGGRGANNVQANYNTQNNAQANYEGQQANTDNGAGNNSGNANSGNNSDYANGQQANSNVF